jgi:hypothetical protein
LSVDNVNQKITSSDFAYPSSQSSRRSSHSTATNTDDDQYELARQLASNVNPTTTENKPLSSPEKLSSATSLSSPSSSDDDEPRERKTKNDKKPIIHESGRFEPVEMTAEQANLLEEASTTA